VLLTQACSTCSPQAALQMNISRYNTFPGKVGVESQCICAVMSCLFVETFATLLAHFVETCRPQRHPVLCPELHLLSFLLLSSVCLYHSVQRGTQAQLHIQLCLTCLFFILYVAFLVAVCITNLRKAPAPHEAARTGLF